MPTRLTGTALLTQRPKVFLERANTNGTPCSRHVSMMVWRASSRPPVDGAVFQCQCLKIILILAGSQLTQVTGSSTNAMVGLSDSIHFIFQQFQIFFVQHNSKLCSVWILNSSFTKATGRQHLSSDLSKELG